MKTFTLSFALFFLTVTYAADFETKRELSLEATGIVLLDIDCGGGFLKVEGDKSLDEIQVNAEIKIDSGDEEDFDKTLDKIMRLTLKKRGSKARLDAGFDRDNSFWRQLFNGGFNGTIDLTVKVPYNLDMRIDDGSGFIEIKNLGGNLDIDDGSGRVTIEDVAGEIIIDDGSGEVTIINCGPVKIDDGTGSVHIMNINGSVWLDDGSGEIVIKDIKGNVEVDDGSGDIEIKKVSGDVIIKDSGSGKLYISDVEGKVIKEDD